MMPMLHPLVLKFGQITADRSGRVHIIAWSSPRSLRGVVAIWREKQAGIAMSFSLLHRFVGMVGTRTRTGGWRARRTVGWRGRGARRDRSSHGSAGPRAGTTRTGGTPALHARARCQHTGAQARAARTSADFNSGAR